MPSGAPTAMPAMRNAATVSAVSAADTSKSSLEPAAEVTTQPTATAVLKVDSPASVPPAAARTASAATTAV